MTFSVAEVSELQLANHLEPNSFAFLGWLSFDARCLAAPAVLKRAGHTRFQFVSFEESRGKHKDNLAKLRKVLRKPKLEPLAVTRDDQIQGYLLLRSMITKLVAKHQTVLVDLSAFPREYVCLIARIASQFNKGDIQYVYNHAFDYSTQQADKGKWLSIGTGSVETVLTFPGTFIPGRPVVMIALMGLDGERVASMVEAIEPSVLLIGTPSTSDGRRDWISARIADTSKRLEMRVAKVSYFTFDCDDVESTMASISVAASSFYASHNVCIAPNNNKISTFAASQLAIQNRFIQVSYAPALLYNVNAYATPSVEYQIIIEN
jgi:hypothetical protein